MAGHILVPSPLLDPDHALLKESRWTGGTRRPTLSLGRRVPRSTGGPPFSPTEGLGPRRRGKGAWDGLRAPATIARLVWLVGVVSLVSAASPAFHDRARVVAEIVPPVFPAAATTGTLAAGVVLMLLAKGLRRGKFRAWLLATVLTAFATVAHVVKGLDVEEATLTATVFLLLVASRHRFRALPDPRSPRRILALVGLGVPLATLLGFVWISADLDGLSPGSTPVSRLTEAFLGLVGVAGPVSFVSGEAAERTSVGLAVLGAALVLLVVVVALQPAAGPHRLDLAERDDVRLLLDRWGAVDSLSWFALRGDRAVIFSPSRKAGVSYRIVGGVCWLRVIPWATRKPGPVRSRPGWTRPGRPRLAARRPRRQRARRRGLPPRRPRRAGARRRGDPPDRRLHHRGP